MKILLNSTKTMDAGIACPRHPGATKPRQMKQARMLADQLRPLSEARLAKLMSVEREAGHRDPRPRPLCGAQPKQPRLRPFLAFTGLVYKYIEAGTLTTDQLKHAQRDVRILSGLYGLLRPLDLVEFYRLEMGSKLKPKGCQEPGRFLEGRAHRGAQRRPEKG